MIVYCIKNDLLTLLMRIPCFVNDDGDNYHNDNYDAV